jgi:hypothetical protein
MLRGKNLTLTFDLENREFQIFLRTKYVPSLVKIHWKMLILECSQGCYKVKIRPCDLDLWPWKSIGFQTLLRTKYVPSLVKIHLQFYPVTLTIDLWPWKSIGFQTLLRTKYVPSLVKIHWKMFVDSRVFTRMLRHKNLTPWPLTYDLENQVFQILLRTRYVPSLVKMHRRMLILECSQGCYGQTEGQWRYYMYNPSQLVGLNHVKEITLIYKRVISLGYFIEFAVLRFHFNV